MTLKSIAIPNFLPPAIEWPAPTVPMDIPCTALGYCDDGNLLAILMMDANEVLNRIPRDQLFAQCAALKEQSPWSYLIINGSLEPHKDGMTIADGQRREWRWSAVQGALLTIQELGIAILYIEQEQELGVLLARLGKRDRTTKRALAQRGIEPLSPAEDLLLSLPNIGERTALSVLHQCGSAMWSLIALTSYDSNIPGIGNKTILAVREALGLRDDEQIYLISPGDRIVPAVLQEIAA